MASLLPSFQQLCQKARRRTLLMGVLNVTPDSFYDGGLYLDPERALARAEEMFSHGADIVDLGGESSRPGAEPVSLEEELRRVLPVAQGISRLQGTWSIDTCKAAVAERCLDLGACLINDISALSQDPAMPGLAAQRGCGVVLMHRKALPKNAQWSSAETACYGEEGVIAAVRRFLQSRVTDLMLAGLSQRQFWIDPGFGFGKSVDDNLALLKGLPELNAIGYPVLLGASRKSALGAALGGLAEAERLEATAASTALAVWLGAACLRVHDVKEMVRVARFAQAVKDIPQSGMRAA